MTELQIPEPVDVGSMYDKMTDLITPTLGENVHFGYWHDDEDDASCGEAADRITDVIADRVMLTPAKPVLDVGCGRPAVRVATRYQVRVTGITVSEHRVLLAQMADMAGFTHESPEFQRFGAETVRMTELMERIPQLRYTFIAARRSS